jgi:hypothetical protein
MKALLLLLLFGAPFALTAQTRDTTWRVQLNQRTVINHEGADANREPVEIKKLKKADVVKVVFRLSELMPKEQTLELLDAKKQVVWTKTYTKITESKAPSVEGEDLIKAANKSKLKIVGRLTLVIKAPELIRACVLGELQIRAIEK